MENKKKNRWAYFFSLWFALPLFTQAQFFAATTAFSAVNKVNVVPAVTVMEQSTTTASNFSGGTLFVKKASEEEMTASNLAVGDRTAVVSLFPYKLHLTYAVPTYVYWDWKYVHDRAQYLMINNYIYNDDNLQTRLICLANNDFYAYSHYSGVQQKLEFRAGLRDSYPYSGSFLPVRLNYNPILATKIFSAP